MSGIIDKIKSMFTSERADQAADQVETHATDERIDDTVNRVPGGGAVAGRVPDNAGQKAADAIRDAAPDDDEAEHSGGGTRGFNEGDTKKPE
jgi:hypothetical protein